jgi:hypothetical protein
MPSAGTETPSWFSPMKIRNRMTSENIRAETIEEERLEKESTEK